MGGLSLLLVGFLVIMIMCWNLQVSDAELSKAVLKQLNKVNKGGPYILVLTPNPSEMIPLLGSESYTPTDQKIKYIDCAGRRFHIGLIDGAKVIVSITGKGMINAASTALMALNMFMTSHVLHYGIAANADPDHGIGDVAIPRSWAHTGIWNWQKYGDGPDDELSFEKDGDFTREIGYLHFAKFSGMGDDDDDDKDNSLNRIWYQPEETYPSDGTSSSFDHTFWVSVDPYLYEISKNLEDLKLERCLNTTTCLPDTPKVVTSQRGSSASMYIDNAAYKNFLHSKFHVGPLDMESAAIGLMCHQERVPFIAMRALHDLAEGNSTDSYGATTFKPLHTRNAINALLEFMKNMKLSRASSK